MNSSSDGGYPESSAAEIAQSRLYEGIRVRGAKAQLFALSMEHIALARNEISTYSIYIFGE